MSVDAAFASAGKKEGLEAWRIENLQPVPLPASEHGKLHNGDSYIFLKTAQRKRCVPARLASRTDCTGD
jgi:hypothetical protein